MPIRVTLAGRVGVEVDGVVLRGSRVGSLGKLALAYLVCHRDRPVTRDELADVLWGDDLPSSWQQMLRGIAFRLRGLLGEAGLEPSTALTTEDGAYQLCLPTDATLDVVQAAEALEMARGALNAGYAGTARAQAAQAAAIADSDFAAGLGGAWVEHRQAELRELRIEALELVARAALAEGDWPGALAVAEGVVSLESYRESAHRILIDAHAWAGNRGEALRAYERCRRTLAEELGVGPSAGTEAAYIALLGDDASQEAPVAATALPLPLALVAATGSFVVGREAEEDALGLALKRAIVEGRAGILVGGEPGVGKTSLVAKAARAAQQGGARVLYGRCDEGLGVAYQPFARALEHYAAHCPLAELRTHVACHGGVLASLLPALARRIPEAPPPPPTGEAAADRWRLFQAVEALLGTASSHAPVVLVLDDLQWAPTSTLLLFRHLVSEPTPAALLVIGTFRDSEVAAGQPLAAMLADLRRFPAVERLNLKGLDYAGVSAFLEATGVAGQAGMFAPALYDQTAGNPFFVSELVRHFQETGDPLTRELPSGVSEVVGRRVGRLSKHARDALVVAAVVGDEFDLDVVERAAGIGDVLAGLEQAQSASLISEAAEPGRYLFAHALVRQTLYEALSGTRRARLHRRVGESLEAIHGDTPEVLPALARHFSRGAIAGSLDKATYYALAAARHAADHTAREDAVEFVEEALAALGRAEPNDHLRKSELLLALAHLLGWLAEGTAISAAREASLLAAEAARAAGSPENLLRAALAYNHPRTAAGETGRRLAQEALGAVGEEPRLRALALVAVGMSDPLDPGNDSLSADALALARRSGDRQALVAALRLRAWAHRCWSRPAELLPIAHELSAVGGGCDGLRFRAMAASWLGNRSGFEAAVEEVALIAETLRYPFAMGLSRIWRVTRALLDGRLLEAEILARDAAKHAHYDSELSLFIQLSKAFWDLGRLNELQPMRAKLVGEKEFAVVRPVVSLSHIEAGNRLSALSELDEQLAELSSAFPGSVSFVLSQLAIAAVALESIEHAQPIYDALLPHAGTVPISGPLCVNYGSADHHLGALAALLGDLDAAEDHLQRALELHRHLASPPASAATQYEYGKLKLRRGGRTDQQRGSEVLANSLALARKLGMARLSSEVQTTLRSFGLSMCTAAP